MTAELDALKKKRLKWVEANRENGFDEGINRLLTELYPDNAHFIYELLQNAEDPLATEVNFNLSISAIGFEHNGKRLFTIKDVESITSIGNSTKRDDPTSIGKFGVGFKAVFSYTNTPEIHSGDFHFRIHDLVVPETDGVESTESPGQKTSFSFPFDNPKKQPESAVKEIESGLLDLGDNTLLFLSHIRKIEYTLQDGSMGSLRRDDHEDGRIEIHAKHPECDETISHWMHFDKTVEVTDDNGKPKTCTVAIAYQLELETGKNKDQSQWKIVAVPGGGQVSIYFPAEKETSKLHFHLHAPFASTVARDSVRDCHANDQLRDHLAELIVESLTAIREQGMLTMSFLAVLPNPRDSLAKFYEPIRLAIVDAFKNQALTPTRNGSHAKAESLYRGSAKIADVIIDEDLSLLTDDEIPLWAANPPQLNQRENNFLDSLAIDRWDYEQLSAIFTSTDKEKIQLWLAEKNDEWMMDFYGLLKEAKESHDRSQQRLQSLQRQNWSGLAYSLVRVNSEEVKHVSAKQAYFAPEDKSSLPPEEIHIVKRSVYINDDKSDEANQPAQTFLQNIGVKPFDAKAAIELRLKHYQSPLNQIEDNHYEDIRQFINHWKKNPEEKALFQAYSFFLATSNDKLYWCKATDICLDSPFAETGLSDLIEIHQKKVLWQGYSKKLNENELKDFVEFAKATGVMHKMRVIFLAQEDARKNPNNPYKWDNWTHTGCAIDSSIPELEKYLTVNKISTSQLIWSALITADRSNNMASFKPNQQYSTVSVESQLVYHLKNHAWIPNKQGDFCKPQDLSRDDLLDEFPFDNGNGLLAAIGFGENPRKRSEEYLVKNNKAQEFGFESAERAAKWAELDKLGFSPDELLAKQRRPEQPEDSVLNPERRRKGVLERSENTPSKESISRERSIQPGIENVVAEAKAYLRAKYTNTNGEMVCQCCHHEMPFKIGEYYYFEAVQCIKKIENHHIENRLALCPTCAAMYQYARETDETEIRRLLVEHDAPDDASSLEIPTTLAKKQQILRFVGTHSFDLKTILNDKSQN